MNRPLPGPAATSGPIRVYPPSGVGDPARRPGAVPIPTPARFRVHVVGLHDVEVLTGEQWRSLGPEDGPEEFYFHAPTGLWMRLRPVRS